MRSPLCLRRWRRRLAMIRSSSRCAAETTRPVCRLYRRADGRSPEGMVIRLGEAVYLRRRNALLLAAGYARCTGKQVSDDPKLGLSARTQIAHPREGHLPALRWSSTGAVTWSPGSKRTLGPGGWRSTRTTGDTGECSRVLLTPSEGRGASHHPALGAWAWHRHRRSSREEEHQPGAAPRAKRWSLSFKGPSFPERAGHVVPDYVGLAVPPSASVITGGARLSVLQRR